MPRRLTSSWWWWRPDVQPSLRPFAAGLWMLIAAVIAGATVWATTAWLLSTTDQLPDAADVAKLRVDAVRTGLAAGAGAGAAIGLMLAFRRQHHQEVATALSDYDAAERRITDLYTKAADQLGSDKAPVRLAGLYALERLAQNHTSHRQTIVEVICAYLRMPYDHESSDFASREERQVRLAAQNILNRHLRRTAIAIRIGERPPNPQFWGDIDLDLTDATLIDWNFHGCDVRQAIFIGTQFHGGAYFGEARTTSFAVFGGATFHHHAWFTETTFGGDAWFLETTFASDADFQTSTFNGSCHFTDAHFNGSTDFQATHIQDMTKIHTWPEGWTGETTTENVGRLVPANQPLAPTEPHEE